MFVKHYLNDKQYFGVTGQSLKLRLALAKGFFRAGGDFLGAADGGIVALKGARLRVFCAFLSFFPRV